jgi:hypothetical protein
MTQEAIRAMSDPELVQVIVWAQQEQQARAAQRKQETIAKIKELARSAEISVRIDGVRGRPSKDKPHSNSAGRTETRTPRLRDALE